MKHIKNRNFRESIYILSVWPIFQQCDSRASDPTSRGPGCESRTGHLVVGSNLT